MTFERNIPYETNNHIKERTPPVEQFNPVEQRALQGITFVSFEYRSRF